MAQEIGKEGKRLAWMSTELLVKLKDKKQMHSQWKQRQVSQEEYMGTGWLCRFGVRKAKVKLELNFMRDAKNNKKGFYKCVSQKRKTEKVYRHTSRDKQGWKTGDN